MKLTSPKKIQLFEVGPRDGLQSESKIWTVAQKVTLINKLAEAGVRDIEVGSFVHPKWVPQLADTDKVLKKLKRSRKTNYWAFVPNQRGLERATDAGVYGVGLFVAASETFCKKNVNQSQKVVLKNLEYLLKEAKKKKLKSRVYISTSFHCPYEGLISSKKAKKIIDQVLKMGASEVAISDTTGYANPKMVEDLCAPLIKKYSAKKLALHMHDTRGMALANVLCGMNLGISKFDSSVGGMGGCPYAPAATGNLATEDLVHMLQGMGKVRDVDLKKLRRVGLYCEKVSNKQLPARMLRIKEKKL